MSEKLCSKCQEKKGCDFFYRDKSTKDRLSTWCKNCQKVHRNKDKANVVANRYRKSEKGIKSRNKNYSTPSALSRAKKYRQKIIKSGTLAKRRKNSYHTNEHFRIRYLLSSRIRETMIQQNCRKNNKTLELLGCSLEFFREHIESQFEDWMNWENHGVWSKESKTWHLDHIIPCASFDLSNDEDIKKCFHYTNLQPLEAMENIKKSNKV